MTCSQFFVIYWLYGQESPTTNNTRVIYWLYGQESPTTNNTRKRWELAHNNNMYYLSKYKVHTQTSQPATEACRETMVRSKHLHQGGGSTLHTRNVALLSARNFRPRPTGERLLSMKSSAIRHSRALFISFRRQNWMF